MSGEEDNEALETNIYDIYNDNDTDTDTEINIDPNIEDTNFELEEISEDNYKSSLISLEEFNTFYKKYNKNIKTSKILNK